MHELPTSAGDTVLAAGTLFTLLLAALRVNALLDEDHVRVRVDLYFRYRE